MSDPNCVFAVKFGTSSPSPSKDVLLGAGPVEFSPVSLFDAIAQWARRGHARGVGGALALQKEVWSVVTKHTPKMHTNELEQKTVG